MADLKVQEFAGSAFVDLSHLAGGIAELQVSWSANASGAVDLEIDSLAGVPLRLRTEPIGSVTSYGVTLLDDLGVDALLGKGSGRSATQSEQVQIIESSDPTRRTMLSGVVRFKVAGAGASACGIARLSLGPVNLGALVT